MAPAPTKAAATKRGVVKPAPVKRALQKATPLESQESESVAVPKVARGRKPASITAVAKPPSTVAADKAPAARRGRKPAATKEGESMEDVDEVPTVAPTAAKRSGRRTPTGATAQSTSEQSDAPAEEPARKGRAVRGAATIAATAAKKRLTKASAKEDDAAGAEEAEEDPLDFIAPEEPGPSRLKPPSKATSRGKKKVEVKQEEDDESQVETAPVATTKPARGARGAAVSGLKTPAATTRLRAARKTPATAPAAIEGGDKENTPGSGSGSGPSSTTAVTSEDGVVKLKVSRSRGKVGGTSTVAASKAKAAVKVEPDAAEPARATRVTRARTKTG